MKKNNQSGQSTVEFIFTFIFGVSIIFMVFNSALNYSTGYLIHYATFMASRTYLTSDSYLGTQSAPEGSMGNTEDEAKETFAQYRLDGFKITSDKFEINPLESGGMDADRYITVGAKTTFDMPIDAIGKVTGAANLEMVSESFLGHEPTRAQCANRACVGITGNTNCSNTLDITLYDNGC